MLTMVHSNPARLEGGVFRVDRKFHTGMQEYLHHLDVPILTVHPRLSPERDSSVMDLVAIPEVELGYRVKTLNCSAPNKPLPDDVARLRPEIARSQLIYGGAFTGAMRALSTQTGVPYVGMVEYTLRTTVVFATANADGTLRKTWRAMRAARYYLTEMVPFVRGAALLHCNGYPIYNEAAYLNRRRLLYLDSRMRASMLISPAGLEERLAGRSRRIPRLIFSGRFEPAKGALDVVKIACELRRRDVPCEFIIYGQGSQRAAMDRLVAENGLAKTVKLHEPVPYPQLVETSRECDVFVCCHVQGDPSCTYLESMGSGLPIVGYANPMWTAMQAHSRAGLVTKLGAPDKAAEELRKLLANPDMLDALSRQARSFAADHTFEHEFARRTDSLKELLRARTR